MIRSWPGFIRSAWMPLICTAFVLLSGCGGRASGGGGSTRAATPVADSVSAALRADNPAVAYGTMTRRWINDDVYIYDRQLGTNVVLVAINKNKSADQAISGLYTYLAPGTYNDYLGQTMGGVGITVTGTAEASNPVNNFTLPHNSVSIWVSAGSVPLSIGSVTPRVANFGALVTRSGAGFGATAGTVNFTSGSTVLAATVSNWSNSQIAATVPAFAAGPATVTVTQGAATSNSAPFKVNTSTLIPVNLSVSGTPTLANSDVLMLAGNAMELGAGANTWNGAIGPVPIPSAGSGIQTVSLPAGATVQLKFFVLHTDGITMQQSASHIYTVPTTGVGTSAVTW